MNHLESKLLEMGFYLAKIVDSVKIYERQDDVVLLLVYDKFDGFSLLFGPKDSKVWIRLDFLLEFYLNPQMEVVKKHPNLSSRNFELGEKFALDFIETYGERFLNNIANFCSSYFDWRKENSELILKRFPILKSCGVKF